ncbi:MAG: sarcosine oxidase subunit gamma, partial [Paracoccaceae bacterium]|nr:sarcosine oxidase subunit gamma [Paracoccaceae bacterium]
KSACDGLLPLTRGSVSAAEMSLPALTALSCRADQQKALSSALKTHHGLTLPATQRATGKASARCLWYGAQYLLIGPKPHAFLAKTAALVDQTDGFAAITLKGRHSREVLARLVPIDLSPAVFKQGHSARSLLHHIHISITRVPKDGFLILAPRSMAGTLIKDLKSAMQTVAARDAL